MVACSRVWGIVSKDAHPLAQVAEYADAEVTLRRLASVHR
jgi:hypothetical protein